MFLSSFALLFLSALFVNVHGSLLPCGNAYYDPTKYTCYTGNFLCPVISGAPTFPCGPACYLPSAYSCINGQLGPPVTGNVFTVTVSAPKQSYDQTPLEASGQAFYAGSNYPSTYCPTFVGTSCPPGNVTAFYGDGGALAVEVPGGQQVYIAPSGALSFTQAHSASYPPGSMFGGFGGENGEFVFQGTNSSGWLACSSATQNGIAQIYANIASAPTGCASVTLLLDPFTGGFGAWQYV